MHRVAHSLGLRTTATMMFGCGEELRHRVNHLERLRRIQEDTGGFTAFIPWMFAPDNTPLGEESAGRATAVDYLKTLAVSRLYLDNIDHIQSSWLTPGIKVCQVGLQFGADDVGSILIEENVVFAAGVKNRTNENELRRIISDAGFVPRNAIRYTALTPSSKFVISALRRQPQQNFHFGIFRQIQGRRKMQAATFHDGAQLARRVFQGAADGR